MIKGDEPMSMQHLRVDSWLPLCCVPSRHGSSPFDAHLDGLRQMCETLTKREIRTWTTVMTTVQGAARERRCRVLRLILHAFILCMRLFMVTRLLMFFEHAGCCAVLDKISWRAP